MNFRFWNCAGLAAMFFAGGLVPAPADEPARPGATPIIFSEPKVDTVASNLNQLDAKTPSLEVKASPFKGLESELKKPFEIFDTGRSAGKFRPPSGRIAPPAAPVNNRRLKELIDKRAELMLFGPESGDADLAGSDPFKPAEDTLDAAGRKLKTPLDRYYNRLDRERTALTNEVRSADLADNTKDPDGKEPFGRPFPDPLFGGNPGASVNSLGRLATDAPASGGFFPDQLKPKTFDDLLAGQRPNAPSERSSRVKETRLDEFKRLLDRPAYTPGPNYYSSGRAVAATQPVSAVPLPIWSAPSAPADPRDSFTSRAGLVGAPPQLQSLPGLATSLNPIPPPVLRPKQPPSSFSIPKRQF